MQKQSACIRRFSLQWGLSGDLRLSALLRTAAAAAQECSCHAYGEQQGSPVTGLQAEMPILLAEYRFYDRGDIDTYLELLKCLPDYFSDIAVYEQEKSAAGLFMSDETADKIIDQCKTFIAHPEENLLIEHFNSAVAAFDGLLRAL